MTGWTIAFDGFAPDEEGRRETLCSIGNGYAATRGAWPEADDDGVHYPGTYIAGVYNRLGSEIGGRVIENESLVNLPNWLWLQLAPADGPPFVPAHATVLDHRQELDVRRAVVTRHSRLRDGEGRVIRIVQRRFASMRDHHLMGLETTIVVENWSGALLVRSGIDTVVRNRGVERYRTLPDEHLAVVDAGPVDDEVLRVAVETNQSHVRIGEAVRTRVSRDGKPTYGTSSQLWSEGGVIAHEHTVEVEPGTELIVEKVVALSSSRDPATGDPGAQAAAWASGAGSFDVLLRRHAVSWAHTWRRMRLTVGADGEVEELLRLHELHVLQTVSNNSIGSDIGVPARGWNGEAYRGHVFWDELFVSPFLSLRFPQLARSLLLYRHRRLDAARQAATEAGLTGAMFPWQSASDGREETQTMHLNPLSGRWLADASHLQRHVNAAIAVNIWQYHQATGDLEFLRFFGAEVMLEIARLWASMATYDHTLDRYEIKGVMGPDEYHERYPDRETPGLDNNAYTNVMAVWCLCRASELLDVLPPVSADELRERLELGADELERWQDISRKMRVCFHDGVISQFEGYEDLEELDWARYRERYGDIGRLDRILESEGDTTNRYRVAKQADVLMLFYVLSAEELATLLERLGYRYDKDLIGRNIAYYTPRTSHGSTLSRIVQAWVMARRDRRRSWEHFVSAVRSDFDDVQHGTTAEGIHLGAMAGTLDLVQRCYTGLETREDVLRLHPSIPDELGSLAYDIRYRGQLVTLEMSPRHVRVGVDIAEGGPIVVELRGRRHHLRPGESIEVQLD
jgi:trehalose/maltose hydrolase-like predicted phosphorylase